MNLTKLHINDILDATNVNNAEIEGLAGLLADLIVSAEYNGRKCVDNLTVACVYIASHVCVEGSSTNYLTQRQVASTAKCSSETLWKNARHIPEIVLEVDPGIFDLNRLKSLAHLSVQQRKRGQRWQR